MNFEDIVTLKGNIVVKPNRPYYLFYESRLLKVCNKIYDHASFRSFFSEFRLNIFASI